MLGTGMPEVFGADPALGWRTRVGQPAAPPRPLGGSFLFAVAREEAAAALLLCHFHPPEPPAAAEQAAPAASTLSVWAPSRGDNPPTAEPQGRAGGAGQSVRPTWHPAAARAAAQCWARAGTAPQPLARNVSRTEKWEAGVELADSFQGL